jgi:hypothetical protein
MLVNFQQTTSCYIPEDRTLLDPVRVTVLTVVVMKISVFWDIMLLSPLKVNMLSLVRVEVSYLRI